MPLLEITNRLVCMYLYGKISFILGLEKKLNIIYLIQVKPLESAPGCDDYTTVKGPGNEKGGKYV